MRIAALFPGQGTQAPGMGSPWRDHPAWAVVERAEAALGEPVAHLLLDAPADELARTRNAQIAVLVTSLVAWEAARDHIPGPVAFAGHSLGQVSALVASGALPFDDGVRFAAARASATQDAADRHPGKMVAFIGATLDQAADACAASDECWIANDNAPGQLVLAGTRAGVDVAVDRAGVVGVRRTVPIDVGGAFHTPLMQDATDALLPILDEVPFADPRAPVISNLDARAHADSTWGEACARHVSTPVRWRESLEVLARLGVDDLVEVGHGSMLASLAKRTIKHVPVRGIGSPDQIEAAAK